MLKKIAVFVITAFSAFAFTVKDSSYAFFEKANENYLLLKDSTYLQPLMSIGHASSDLELKATGAKVIKKNDVYVVYTDQKKEVELTVWNNQIQQKVYSKTFKVYSSPKELKEEAVTNTVDQHSWINRRDVFLKAGMKSKFIYTTNTSVSVVCSGGKVSDVTTDCFCITPDKGSSSVKVLMKDTYGPMVIKDYLVK